MVFGDLQRFLATLEAAGELHRVHVAVDPELEIAEITNRVSKSVPSPALLFEQVKGSRFPVVTNVFGSIRRVCTALGVDDADDLGRRVSQLLLSNHGAAGSLAPLNQEKLAPFRPHVVTRGTCQEVVEAEPNLMAYPFLKNWPADGLPASGGRFITLPQVITRDPEDGTPNTGMYRVEILDAARACIHWRGGSGGARHYDGYCRRGERMPVAVAVGGDPVLTFAASLSLPVEELSFAGFLRRKPLEAVSCRTSTLVVPASAELVIEGYVDPGDTITGGSFGNHTGFYAPGAEAPVLHVTAITRRSKCILPATVVGPPPMEDCYLAKVAERLLLPLLKRRLPQVTDINMPLEGIFHGCAVVAISKDRPRQGRETLHGLWSAGFLGDARLLVVVDHDVTVTDLSLIGWRVLNQVQWQRDLVSPAVFGKVPMGGRLGIDATRKLPGELSAGELSLEVAMAEEVRRMVTERWGEYGL